MWVFFFMYNICATYSLRLMSWIQPVSESLSVMSDSLQPHGLYSPWNSPGQNTGMGSLALLRGIFPTQWSNLHCRWILYHLSHKESLGILEWVAYPIRGTSWPRNRTGVSFIAGGFFTNWAIREAIDVIYKYSNVYLGSLKTVHFCSIVRCS